MCPRNYNAVQVISYFNLQILEEQWFGIKGPLNHLSCSNNCKISRSFTSISCTIIVGHIATYSSSSKANTQHGGSYTKYTELLHKHQRSPQGPMDVYHHPLTTSQMYGWWMSHGQPHRQDWAQGPRHVHVNSEMTRYLKDSEGVGKGRWEKRV